MESFSYKTGRDYGTPQVLECSFPQEGFLLMDDKARGITKLFDVRGCFMGVDGKTVLSMYDNDEGCDCSNIPNSISQTIEYMKSQY
jgi:hypothetical protein